MADGRLCVQSVHQMPTDFLKQILFTPFKVNSHFFRIEKNSPGRQETPVLPSERPPSVHTCHPEINKKHTCVYLGRLQQAAVFYDFMSDLVGDEQQWGCIGRLLMVIKP